MLIFSEKRVIMNHESFKGDEEEGPPETNSKGKGKQCIFKGGEIMEIMRFHDIMNSQGRKPRRPGEDAYYGNDDVMSARKIRPFDDDKGPLVSVKPDPRVDSRASVFIANFHAARISESESQIFQQAAGKAA
ncbi:hypothetical protein SADUNF_Sadunf05G0002000 [Salix dunnii]|uniref:Uncharacterized protein n=1 Tax=Salix dunnii TaxID=1413687 RepID=A0A835N3E5_9ROSI|nr:hypothetical protein SADUNF_Sadunf05G0002000 [Salix dunnii]